MGDGELVVNFSALQQASADINNGINNMNSQLSQCEQDAAPLVATWEGDAQDAYNIRQVRWRQAANDLSQMLRDIKAALDESAQSYQDTERRNTTLFQ